VSRQKFPVGLSRYFRHGLDVRKKQWASSIKIQWGIPVVARSSSRDEQLAYKLSRFSLVLFYEPGDLGLYEFRKVAIL
jgi:hypothetical protein